MAHDHGNVHVPQGSEKVRELEQLMAPGDGGGWVSDPPETTEERTRRLAAEAEHRRLDEKLDKVLEAGD